MEEVELVDGTRAKAGVHPVLVEVVEGVFVVLKIQVEADVGG
jgi:hypothetical protein